MKTLILIIQALILSFTFGFVCVGSVGLNPILGGAVTLIITAVAIVAQFFFQFLPPGIAFVTVCGQIAASLTFNCLNPLQGGVRDRIYIINQADWDDPDTVITYSLTNPMLVTAIVLPATKVAYYVEGKNNSSAPSFELVKQTYADVFNHILTFKVFDLTNAAKAQLQSMVGGKYVVVFENNFRGTTGESAFEILGSGVGLEFKTFTRDPNNADTQGAYDINMATPEVGKEGKIPLSFFDTDYATTKAAVEALLVP